MRTWPALDVGNVSDPDLLQTALADFAVTAIHEREPDLWRVFFGMPGDRDGAIAAIAPRFPALRLTPVDVPDEDWASRSQASLHAVRVGDIIVAPPWDVPAPAESTPAADSRPRGPLTIVIQPSMGFGTGHHATTRLCLAALQQFDVHGRAVVDIGTGSGVLAIAASLRGASRVVAVDDDPDAVEAARDNARINGVAVETLVADFRHLVLARFDLVLANLTGAVLIGAAGKLRDLAARRGPLIISGFTRAEEPAVVAAFPHLEILDRAQEDEWVCLILQHRGAFE
jgi:ribosomal protein L11 methyltransferase